MKYPLFATLKEFIITQPKTVALEIADKLYQFHIIPMQKVRDELGVWATASARSGYRPRWWEKNKGRSATSQHVFEEEWINGSGAIDWTCKDFQENKDKFLELIIKHTNYTRMCVYDSFIHCDFKDTPGNVRQLFEYGYDEEDEEYKWLFIKNAA